MKFYEQETTEDDANIRTVDFSEILKLKKDKGLVARSIKLQDLESRYSGKLTKDYSGVELSEIGKRLFKELKDKYKIVVPVRFLISDNGDEKTLFSFVDKIEHVEIKQNEDFRAIFYGLYERLSEYYLDKLKIGAAFLTDISSSEQYVYGISSTGEKKKGIYLVDTDLYFDDREESLLTVVYWLVRHASWVDKKSQMIMNVKTFVNEYQKKFELSDSRNQEMLKQLNDFLEGKEFGEEVLPAIPTFD